MREKSRNVVNVRGVEIGGETVPVCLPLVSSDRESLLEEGAELVRLGADVIEWRIDAYGGNLKSCLSTLERIRAVVDDIPLLFTCRAEREGGMGRRTDGERLELILTALESGWVDLVDVELDNGSSFLDTVARQSRTCRVPLILSAHDFTGTGTREELLAILRSEFSRGADIAKLAVMPRSMRDVLTLLLATEEARSFASGPLVTISMGEMGRISRIAGGLFGSDMTFGAGVTGSAPGQMKADDLRAAMSWFY